MNCSITVIPKTTMGRLPALLMQGSVNMPDIPVKSVRLQCQHANYNAGILEAVYHMTNNFGHQMRKWRKTFLY